MDHSWTENYSYANTEKEEPCTEMTWGVNDQTYDLDATDYIYNTKTRNSKEQNYMIDTWQK